MWEVSLRLQLPAHFLQLISRLCHGWGLGASPQLFEWAGGHEAVLEEEVSCTVRLEAQLWKLRDWGIGLAAERQRRHLKGQGTRGSNSNPRENTPCSRNTMSLCLREETTCLA
jgi:hypothetical protein